MSEIIGVSKNDAGVIEKVKLSNGRVVTRDRAIEMTKKGQIDGAHVGRSRNGKEVLRGDPTSGALGNLPTF